MQEIYNVVGTDPANPLTHMLIEVRGTTYSVANGKEADTANEIGNNRDMVA